MVALPSLRMMENTFIYMHHTWPNGLLYKSVRLQNEISTEFHNYTTSWIRLSWVDGWVNEQNLKPSFSSTHSIISSTPTKLNGVMTPADKVLLNPRSFGLQSRRVFGVSCLLITLALFIIKDTAFHITRVIWCVLGVLCYHLWNSIGNLVNLVFGLCQYCSKNSNIQLTKLTNSRF